MMTTSEYIDVPKGEGDEIETPPWLWAFLNKTFDFSWDACATAENSLVIPSDVLDALAPWPEWAQTVFMNPPYSKPKGFLKQAVFHMDRGTTTVALIKGDPSTSWWRMYVNGHATVQWLPYRIRFYYKGKPCRHLANFPSVLAIYWGTRWRPSD